MVMRLYHRNTGCRTVCHALCAALLGLAVLPITGCSIPPTVVSTTGPGSTASTSLTGNWQISASTTSGTAPFQALSGAILETASQAGSNPALFANLQAVAPGGCYSGATAIPLSGFRSKNQTSLDSLPVLSQVLNLSSTSNDAGTTLNGLFTVSGGCGNAVKGTVSGIRIPTFTGTFSGAWSGMGSPATITLKAIQNSSADGLGYFHVSGSATFSGISCFNSGTLQAAQSTVSGQQVQLVLLTNELNPSSVLMTGLLDPTATSLSLSQIQILSGTCAGTGTGTLGR